MAMGELEAEILGAVQRLSRASARKIKEEVEGCRLAYTTINTVLDRLHEKGMVKRATIIGGGGTKYVYSPVSSAEVRVSVVDRTLDRLVSAYCPSICQRFMIASRESPKEATDLKRKITRA